MKTSRAELKAIVKECLTEILQEGLGSSSLNAFRSASTGQKKAFTEKFHRSQSQNSPSSSLREAIRAEAGGNKIMEDILSDTANSTLQKMLQNEGRKQPTPTGTAEQIVAAVDPEDIFGTEVTSKWADLAFMDSSRNK